MKDFTNKVVVIIGGATGIGKAMADRFGAKGAQLILAARREDRLQEAVAGLTAKGIEARYKTCDVSSPEDVQALADFAWAEFGQVDVLVNNAGITGGPVAVVDATPEAYQQVFNVNIFGMLNGLWAFGNQMIAQGTPALILNVNSETGLYVPGPMMGAYPASKHAARAISEVLRLELPEQVQVGVIYPGLVQSELGGSPEMTSIGMPTEEFIDIIWPQIENGEFHIVSHPWARDCIAEDTAELTQAFDRYAPHFDGDRDRGSAAGRSRRLARLLKHRTPASGLPEPGQTPHRNRHVIRQPRRLSEHNIFGMGWRPQAGGQSPSPRLDRRSQSEIPIARESADPARHAVRRPGN